MHWVLGHRDAAGSGVQEDAAAGGAVGGVVQGVQQVEGVVSFLSNFR